MTCQQNSWPKRFSSNASHRPGNGWFKRSDRGYEPRLSGQDRDLGVGQFECDRPSLTQPAGALSAVIMRLPKSTLTKGRPMPVRDFSLIGHIVFLRQAASELREAASHEPGSERALRHIADQIDVEADDLARATGLTGVGFI